MDRRPRGEPCGRVGPFRRARLSGQIRRSATFREEIEASVALGIPRSVFLGRVVGQGEPLWTRDDAQAVLEYLREKALLCSGCGLPRDETMDPEAEGHFASRALRCHACAARDRAARKFGGDQGASLYYTIEKTS